MPVPFARSASQTRPTFSRDFAGLKTLDHGAGPAIAFTRGSNATYFNAAGTLTTATTNEPRFDHNPSTGASLGLLIEESRTNSIRNSQAGGSTNGVIGSGGVMPTNWVVTPNANGVTSEVVGTGSDDGLAYIDIKISGTPTLSSGIQIRTETDTQVVATSGQTWTHSAYSRLIAGSAANAVFAINVRGNVAGGSGVSGQQVNTTFVPTSSAIGAQRRSATVTFTNATVERVMPFFGIDYTSGNPIDLTLRIAAPQLEQGAFPTSYIPTTTAAATRSADSAVVTPISSFYNQSEGTLFAEWNLVNLSGNRSALMLTNAAETNRLLIQARSAGGATRNLTFINSVAEVTNLDFSNLQSGTTKNAFTYAAGNYAATRNAAAVLTNAHAAVPSEANTLVIAADTIAGANALNGHIRKIAYWPKRLSNTLLQQLTT